jgi:hypothetical protein
MMAGYIAGVHQRSLPAWLSDARFWCTLFVVLFWPAAIFFHLAGAIVLLVVVFGAWLALQAIARRGTPGEHPSPN